ncbi:MAG: MBL fold metallo-hydrolase [Patescibacteria group bacterium]|nr:MBL fold metallo-hydrolase [Patescibacteria group bacterium]
MNIKLTSYGGVQEVTGSCHLLNLGGLRILVDCGLFQGGKENYLKNWDDFPFDPQNIDAVILTHAHLDHCGRLPLLYQRGYRGPVYCTPPTSELAKIILNDAHKIMAEKAQRQKLNPLYKEASLKKLYQNLKPINYYQSKQLTPDISFQFYNAGHILGAAIVEIKTASRTIVFSGDIGGQNMPLVKDIDYLKDADYIICESTYGDRRHEGKAERDQKLIEAVKRNTLKNGVLLISIFALERTQDVLKVLNDYYESHLDFKTPVYLDSPMAISATKVYRQNTAYLNPAAQDQLRIDADIFSFPHLKLAKNVKQSKLINQAPSPKIIIAGSGMMEGGRILHHLARYAPDAKNKILFMGYQVPGTFGHRLLNGAFDFDYYGKKVNIKAAIDKIDGFSSHGDQNELLKWLGSFAKPKQIILAHGDLEVMKVFVDKIKEKLGHQALINRRQETLELK